MIKINYISSILRTTSNDTISKVRRQLTQLKKTFTDHIFDKDLASTVENV